MRVYKVCISPFLTKGTSSSVLISYFVNPGFNHVFWLCIKVCVAWKG